MNVISAATIVFGAVLLWTSSTCNGQAHGNCTSCSSQSPCPALMGILHTTAATSCQEIYQTNPHAPSGNYWLRGGQHSAANVTEQYCDMDGTYDGIKGGWLRVAYLDMEDAGTRCPSPLQETNPGKRLCIKSAPTGCSSVVYSTHGVPYSRICGRVTGYQYRSTDIIHTTLQMPLANTQDRRTLTVLTQMACPSPTGALASTCGLTQEDYKRKQTTMVMPVLVGKSLVTNHLPL